jgi:hypothetical protein
MNARIVVAAAIVAGAFAMTSIAGAGPIAATQHVTITTKSDTDHFALSATARGDNALPRRCTTVDTRQRAVLNIGGTSGGGPGYMRFCGPARAVVRGATIRSTAATAATALPRLDGCTSA